MISGYSFPGAIIMDIVRITSNTDKVIAYSQTAGQDRLTCEAEEYDSVYFNEVGSSLFLKLQALV